MAGNVTAVAAGAFTQMYPEAEAGSARRQDAGHPGQNGHTPKQEQIRLALKPGCRPPANLQSAHGLR